jgi:hypothetical protein
LNDQEYPVYIKSNIQLVGCGFLQEYMDREVGSVSGMARNDFTGLCNIIRIARFKTVEIKIL